MNYLEGLNPEQLQAVRSAASTICVNAGPGTGKTKTLIARILYLLDQQVVLPSQILALTFTKKAATEMRERLAQAAGAAAARHVWIGTFHAFCHQILQRAGKAIPLVAEDTRVTYLKEAIEVSGWKGSVREASTEITRMKNSLTSEHEALLDAYNQILRKHRIGDYDDILFHAYTLCREDTALCTAFQDEYIHILIDEFQDTSPVQYELIKLLCKESSSEKHLYIIGDPFQSIYAFRGSSADIFSRLQSEFPDHEQITLSLNYRSNKNIITVSSRLFPQIHLKATRPESGSVQIVQCLNEFAEADFVVSCIGREVGGTDLLHASKVDNYGAGCRFSDCAVIYRSHRLRYPLTTAFMRSGIPFQAIGEESPFHKISIRCIIDCLRFIYTKDNQSISKLDNYPFIKPLDIEKYLIAVHAKSAKVTDLIQNIEHLFALSEVFKKDKEYTIDQKQFTQSLIPFNSQKNGLEAALLYLDFLQEHEFYDSSADRVTFLTMHAAKGLEFSHVYLCGFEDGIIPHGNKNIFNGTEEEKRLLYVALTRAKESLTLSYTRSRDKKPSYISPFYERLISAELHHHEDENTVRIAKRIEKIKIKKSQMKLF